MTDGSDDRFFRDGSCCTDGGDHGPHCVCCWKEAYDNNCASKVNLEATSVIALEFVDLDDLKQHAIK